MSARSRFITGAHAGAPLQDVAWSLILWRTEQPSKDMDDSYFCVYGMLNWVGSGSGLSMCVNNGET